jgi:hypothetical protein
MEDIRGKLSHYVKPIRAIESMWSGEQMYNPALTGSRIARMVAKKKIHSYINIASNKAIMF